MRPIVLFFLLLISVRFVYGQAGPPFLNDDPDTPGNRHWEINFGFTALHNPGASYYQTPDFDFNYGWGDRIQLKYELPISEYTNLNDTTVAGLGESLLGIKGRFYEHRRAGSKPDDDKAVNFSLGTYPQLSLNNPTSAVRRNVVQYPGPNFLLPIETNARIGWLRLDGQVGYWFGNAHAPQDWIRGLVAGHEFTEKTELYAEIFDEQDANRIDGAPKQRETVLDLGGRHAIDRNNSVLLLFMAGRGFQAVTVANGQPNWVAYAGLQLLLGPKEKDQVRGKLPNEDNP
jgi:hypothetical protein